jgi:hypothetical protein
MARRIAVRGEPDATADIGRIHDIPDTPLVSAVSAALTTISGARMPHPRQRRRRHVRVECPVPRHAANEVAASSQRLLRREALVALHRQKNTL